MLRDVMLLCYERPLAWKHKAVPSTQYTPVCYLIVTNITDRRKESVYEHDITDCENWRQFLFRKPLLVINSW
jgi:hypothetical protein